MASLVSELTGHVCLFLLLNLVQRPGHLFQPKNRIVKLLDQMLTSYATMTSTLYFFIPSHYIYQPHHATLFYIFAFAQRENIRFQIWKKSNLLFSIKSPNIMLGANQRRCLILLLWLVLVLSNVLHLHAARPRLLSGSGSSNCTGNGSNTGGSCP